MSATQPVVHKIVILKLNPWRQSNGVLIRKNNVDYCARNANIMFLDTETYPSTISEVQRVTILIVVATKSASGPVHDTWWKISGLTSSSI